MMKSFFKSILRLFKRVGVFPLTLLLCLSVVLLEILVDILKIGSLIFWTIFGAIYDRFLDELNHHALEVVQRAISGIQLNGYRLVRWAEK